MTRLSGRVVATTRDGEPGDPLTRKLEAEGATVVEWPTLAFAPPNDEDALHRVRRRVHEEAFDWVVFTSARAVTALGPGDGVPGTVRVAAVGHATADALRTAGWRVDETGTNDARDLAEQMARGARLDGSRILFPAGSLAGSALEETLGAFGADVARVEAYKTLEVPPDEARVRADLERGVDVVAFASPSAVRSFARALGAAWTEELSGVGVAAIGPSTERALVEQGIEPGRIVTAAPPGLDALVDACGAAVAGHRDDSSEGT